MKLEGPKRQSSDDDVECIPVVSTSEAKECVTKLCNYAMQVNDADVVQLLKTLQIKFERQAISRREAAQQLFNPACIMNMYFTTLFIFIAICVCISFFSNTPFITVILKILTSSSGHSRLRSPPNNGHSPRSLRSVP